MSDSHALSQGIGPLASLDENALRALAPHGTVRAFPKNALIITEGDETDSLYVLLAGRIKVFVSDEEGKEMVLSTAREGNYFGEMVLDGGPRSASVMALEPCRCFVMPMSDIEGLLERNPMFARHLIHMLIAKTRSLVKQVTDLALKDVYGRFAKFVDDSAVEQDGARVVPERLTQQDIAARIGGSREMVNRIVKDLTAGGYISVDAKHIKIHKRLPAHW
ncbi:MAG TPA: Crp/Fnr family transcriptional regulator [Burkholderiales bacterium]|nr:Crp/Fnr family transcriptional regulator [Burkholderiales bacterium]